MTELVESRRGKYAKIEDVQFIAAIIEERQLHLASPSSRPIFLLDGRIYPYTEVARRKRRAKKSGTWPEKLDSTIPWPDNIRMIPARKSSTQSEVLPANVCQRLRNETSLVHTTSSEEQTEYLFHYCYHQLVLQQDTRMYTVPSDPEALQKTARLCYNISRYVKGAHDQGLFITNDTGELVSRSSPTSFTNLNNFYKCCIIGVDLWEKQLWKQGGVMLAQALILLVGLLDEQDPKLLDVLCDLCM